MGMSKKTLLWTTGLHTYWDLSFLEKNALPILVTDLSLTGLTEKDIAAQEAVRPASNAWVLAMIL